MRHFVFVCAVEEDSSPFRARGRLFARGHDPCPCPCPYHDHDHGAEMCDCQKPTVVVAVEVVDSNESHPIEQPVHVPCVLLTLLRVRVRDATPFPSHVPAPIQFPVPALVVHPALVNLAHDHPHDYVPFFLIAQDRKAEQGNRTLHFLTEVDDEKTILPKMAVGVTSNWEDDRDGGGGVRACDGGESYLWEVLAANAGLEAL